MYMYIRRVDIYSPILTGNPGGNFICTKSLSLAKCLNGAITSKTLNNLSVVKGKSSLYKLYKIKSCSIEKSKKSKTILVLQIERYTKVKILKKD